VARIAVIYRQDFRGGKGVLCYPRCFADSLKMIGYTVYEIGEGHELESWTAAPDLEPDLIIEIENGRNASGKLEFQGPSIEGNIPKAIWFIDSHSRNGEATHGEVAKHYDHVFFAVWSKRDLFAGHPSAHWCPNATDLRYFGYKNFLSAHREYDVAFYSSKLGLARANDLIDVCRKYGWTYDVRECVKPRRNRWPATGEAMSKARVLFNRGQKQDSPNQRVMESMASLRPLISDKDPTSGMDKLFKDGEHYLAFDKRDPEDLADKVRFLLENPKEANEIAIRGYYEVAGHHTIDHRVEQILEVSFGT